MRIPNVPPPKPDLADLIAARQRELGSIYPAQTWRDRFNQLPIDREVAAVFFIVGAFTGFLIGVALVIR